MPEEKRCIIPMPFDCWCDCLFDSDAKEQYLHRTDCIQNVPKMYPLSLIIGLLFLASSFAIIMCSTNHCRPNSSLISGKETVRIPNRNNTFTTIV